MPDTINMIQTQGYRNHRLKKSIGVAFLDDVFNLVFVYDCIFRFLQKEAVATDECRDIRLVTLLRICDYVCLTVD